MFASTEQSDLIESTAVEQAQSVGTMLKSCAAFGPGVARDVQASLHFLIGHVRGPNWKIGAIVDLVVGR